MYNSVLHCFILVDMSGMLSLYNMCTETFYIAIVKHYVLSLLCKYCRTLMHLCSKPAKYCKIVFPLLHNNYEYWLSAFTAMVALLRFLFYLTYLSITVYGFFNCKSKKIYILMFQKYQWQHLKQKSKEKA